MSLWMGSLKAAPVDAGIEPPARTGIIGAATTVVKALAPFALGPGGFIAYGAAGTRIEPPPPLAPLRYTPDRVMVNSMIGPVAQVSPGFVVPIVPAASVRAHTDTTAPVMLVAPDGQPREDNTVLVLLALGAALWFFSR